MPHPDLPRPAIDPVVWTPPEDPGLAGPFAANQRLAGGQRLPVPGAGPEDVAIGADGTLYAGTEDGSILALAPDGSRLRRVAATTGRPLGIEVLDDERLLVCDAYRGLLAVTITDGATEVLLDADADGLGCTNNAVVADDGTIWFSDSTQRFPLVHYVGDIIEHRGTGRVLRRDVDGSVEVVLDGLHFANGVTLSPDESILYVAETGMFRVLAHPLTGDDAGTTREFVSVPGFPDNLSTGPTGTIWCALASTRNPLSDALAPLPAAIRKAVWALPEALLPAAAKVAIVLGFDADGRVVHNLQSSGDDFTMATGMREHDGHLVVASLHADHLLRVAL